MTTTATRTCRCRGATALTTADRDPDCTLPHDGLDADRLAEWHATTYEVPVEIIWPDGGSVTVTAETVGCHTRADCWGEHAPGVAARNAAEPYAAKDSLYVGRAAMGQVIRDGQSVAGWHVYLLTAPLVEHPERLRACRQCGDVSGRCRHGMRGRYGA